MTEKPTLELLRALTDEHVLRALMDSRRATRAELAARTGISKPTISESVRRLTEAEMLVDSGERTTGRGRVGSYFTLSEQIGSALVVSIAPAGVVAENLDPYGQVVSRSVVGVARPADSRDVARALQAVAETTTATAARPVRVAVVSAADPVDRETGRLVHLPDAPFLLGDLSPAEILAPYVDGAVLVDNDVNRAARAERSAAGAAGPNDFVYVHLGEGLGSAVVSDGAVRRGHAGAAGEIAHLLTVGPDGHALDLIDVFAQLELRRSGSTAVDVDALLAAVSGRGAGSTAVRESLARAVCGVLAAAVALADPQLVMIGGAWGTHPIVLDAIRREFDRHPRRVPVLAASVVDEPSLSGARDEALTLLRSLIVDTSQHHSRAARSTPSPAALVRRPSRGTVGAGEIAGSAPKTGPP